VVYHHASNFLDEYLANPMECKDSLNRRLFIDSTQFSKGGCLLQKDNVTIEDKVLDGSVLPKVIENAKAQP